MKREQIIEILERFVTESDDYPDCILRYNFGKVANAILALPLDVPSDKEIEDKSTFYATEEGGEDFEPMLQQPDFIAFYDGAKWMREEIIKRNK